MSICPRVSPQRTATTGQRCPARHCARGLLPPSATVRRRRPRPAQYAALALLLIVLGNLSLTTLTHDWIGALPYHDHLLLDARGMGLLHHAHHGDALAQAFNALQSVAPGGTGVGATADAPDASGVVSLRSFSGLQPELNTYTATGLLALAGWCVFPRRGVRFAPRRFLFRRRSAPAPRLTPPRSA